MIYANFVSGHTTTLVPMSLPCFQLMLHARNIENMEVTARNIENMGVTAHSIENMGVTWGPRLSGQILD